VFISDYKLIEKSIKSAKRKNFKRILPQKHENIKKGIVEKVSRMSKNEKYIYHKNTKAPKNSSKIIESKN